MIVGRIDQSDVPAAEAPALATSVGVLMGFALGVRLTERHPATANKLVQVVEAPLGTRPGLGEEMEQRLLDAAGALAMGDTLDMLDRLGEAE